MLFFQTASMIMTEKHPAAARPLWDSLLFTTCYLLCLMLNIRNCFISAKQRSCNVKSELLVIIVQSDPHMKRNANLKPFEQWTVLFFVVSLFLSWAEKRSKAMKKKPNFLSILFLVKKYHLWTNSISCLLVCLFFLYVDCSIDFWDFCCGFGGIKH